MDITSNRSDGGGAGTASMSPPSDHSGKDIYKLSIPAPPLPPPPRSASYSALQLSPGLGSQAACLSESMPPFLPPEVTSLFSGLMKQRRGVGCRKGWVWMRPVANGAKEWKEQMVELDSSRAALSLLPSAPGQPILTYSLTGVKVERIVEGHPAPSARGDLGEEEGPRRPQSELSFELQLGQGGPRHQVCGVTRSETTEWLEALSRETQSEPVTLRVEGSMERIYGRGSDDDEESEWSSGSEASVFSEGEHVCAYKRKELIRSHLQKPRIPVRKLDLLCRWVSCMGIWPTPVEVETLAKDLSNGLLLCGLMERLVPGTKYVGLHKRPISRGSAIYNLEEALAIIWRTRKVNNTLVPSSEDLYQCKHNKAAWLLAEIFEAYVMSDVRKRASRILEWVNSVLQHYDRHVTGELWKEMQDGASLFCVLFHFCGPNVVGTKALVRKIDARRVYSDPKDINQIRANVQEVLLILKALNIKVPWTVDAWVTISDQDFLLYTLDAIHDRFSSKECALPAAQRGVIGLATQPDGLRRVVGMVFADSQDTRLAAPASTSGDSLGTDVTRARCGGAPRSPQRDATEAAKASTAAERRSRGDLERRWNASVSTEVETRQDETLSPRQAREALKHDNGCVEAVIQATLGNICVVNKDEQKVAMIRDAIETAKRQKAIHSDRIDVELRLVEQHAVELDAQKDHLPPNSYDESIAQLQRKRYQLYKESVKLEHAFQERMAQMEKAMSRTKAGRDGQGRNGHHSPTRCKESRLSLRERERRWIKFTRPSHTYNTMIKGLQRVSEDQSEHMLEQERSGNRKAIGDGTGAQPAAPVQLSVRLSVRKSAKLVTPKGAWKDFKARIRGDVHEKDEVAEFQPPEAVALESPRPYTGRAELTHTIAQIRQAAPQRRQQQPQLQAQEAHDKVPTTVDVMSDVESAAQQYWRAVAADRAKDLAAVPAQSQELARAAAPPRSATPPPAPPLPVPATALPVTQALAPAPSSTLGGPKPASPCTLGPHPSVLQPQQTQQQQPMTEPSALPARQADQHATAPLSPTASTPAPPSRTEPVTGPHAQARAPPQPATQLQLPPPPPPPTPSQLLARDTSSGVVVQPLMSWQARATGLNQQDRNALLRWLMVSRRLVLQERNYERTFDFSVVPLSSVSTLASRAGGAGQYALKWSLGAKRLAGFVALPHGVSKLRLAEKDPSTFVIVLRDDTDVVRSSGGLRALMIKAENPEDASKYLLGMALFNVAPLGA